MSDLVRCPTCATWQERKSPTMFDCPGCRKPIIVGTLPPDQRRTGNWIVCTCRKSSFNVGGHVGDVDITCTSCGTRRVNAASSEVVATLATFGTLVMEFRQGALLELALGSALVKTAGLENGACYGICLHWVRRQLLSKKADRHLFADDNLKKAVAKGAQVQAVAKKTSGDWSEIVSAVDTKQKTRKAESQRLLANIDRYADGSETGAEVKSYVERVCGATFQEGHCALITCHVSAGGRGHTVAVRKTRAGYLLLDPNYGLYDIQSGPGLPNALQWVFCQDSAGIRATAGTLEISHALFRAT